MFGFIRSFFRREPSSSAMQAPARRPRSARSTRESSVRLESPLARRLRELRRAIGRLEAELGPDDGRLLGPLFQLGALQELAGDLEAAERTQRRLLSVGERSGATPRNLARGWSRLAHLCAAQGKVLEAQQAEERAHELVLRPDLAEDLLRQAAEAQRQGAWREALRLGQLARDAGSADDPVVRLNLAICRYRLGAGAAVAPEALELVEDLPLPFKLHAAALAVLCFRERGHPEEALGAAGLLAMAGRELAGWDLPGVPVAVTEELTAEDESVQPLVAALEHLGRAAPPMQAELHQLAHRYARR